MALIGSMAMTVAAYAAAGLKDASGRDGRARLINHHLASPENETSAENLTASKLVSLADEACFARGASIEGLRQWAETLRGTPAPAEDLKRHDNDYASLVGSWMLSTDIGAVAVFQSVIRPPARGHVCSITAKLTSDEQYAQTKSEFERRFESGIAEEKDAADQHIDRYWIERGDKSPIKATIVISKGKRIITIRMIHSNARPLRS